MRFLFNIIAFSLTHLPIFSLAQNAPQRASGAQYIPFSGNITGSVTFASQYNCPVPRYNLGPYALTYLYVGINPPWDSNPFFFELYHLASDTSGFGFTKDAVYNLDFSSAAYECYNGDNPCVYLAVNPRYVPQVYLDLSGKGNGTSNVTKVRIADEDGYSITGANNWIGTGIGDSVNVRAWCYAADVDLKSFTWLVNSLLSKIANNVRNSSTPVSYNLTVTNSTASLSLRTSILTSNTLTATMELGFSGSRNLTAQRASLQLDTTDPSVPKFQYVNGSQIYFSNHSGTWIAAPTPPVGSTTSSLGTPVASPTEKMTSASAVATSRNAVGRSMSPTGDDLYVFVLAIIAFVVVGLT